MSKLEKVVTAALLEDGIAIIDYNQIINKHTADLLELKDLIRRNGLMDSKLTKDLETKIDILERQANEWKRATELPLNQHAHIVIMMETVPKK